LPQRASSTTILRDLATAYPGQLGEAIDLEIKRIQGRIDLLRNDPIVQHPPADELRIPDNLKLSNWPGSTGN
jgi:hypothetical protein